MQLIYFILVEALALLQPKKIDIILVVLVGVICLLRSFVRILLIPLLFRYL